MNYTQIAGHLGADPEERRTPNGRKVVTLRVATKLWHDNKEETLWWNVSVWGDEFDNIIRHLKKGSAVCVLGFVRKPRIYTDREGRPQVSLEMNAKLVTFSPFGKGDRSDQGNEGYTSPYGRAAPSQGHPSYGAPSESSRGDGFPPPFVETGELEFGNFASMGAPSQPYDMAGEAALSSKDDDEMPF